MPRFPEHRIFILTEHSNHFEYCRRKILERGYRGKVVYLRSDDMLRGITQETIYVAGRWWLGELARQLSCPLPDYLKARRMNVETLPQELQ